jgi:putative hydrolase of the HAD superfamily
VSAPAAVFLDALGTLVRLESPTPRLQASLRARVGLEVDEDLASAAMRAEMRYYAANCIRAKDDASLAALRLECADVLADTLRVGIVGAELLPCLTDAIAFRLYDDVAPALAALQTAGLRLAVVSNWDISLVPVLERLGVADRFEAVVHSAGVGASKPDPKLFEAALEQLGLPADAVLHVGDDAVNDIQGAARAGIRAILVDRRGRHRNEDAIASLSELAPLVSAAATGG